MVAHIVTDYKIFIKTYGSSKLIHSSVHIDRVYNFVHNHFSRIPLRTYVAFNGPLDRPGHARVSNTTKLFFSFFYLFIFFCFTTTAYFFFLFFSFPFNFSSFIFFIIFKSEQPQKSGSLFNLHRHLTGKILRKGSSTSLDRAEILRDRSILSHSLVHSPTRIRLFPSGIFKLNDKFFHFLSR